MSDIFNEYLEHLKEGTGAKTVVQPATQLASPLPVKPELGSAFTDPTATVQGRKGKAISTLLNPVTESQPVKPVLGSAFTDPTATVQGKEGQAVSQLLNQPVTRRQTGIIPFLPENAASPAPSTAPTTRRQTGIIPFLPEDATSPTPASAPARTRPAPLGVLPDGGERVGLQSMPQKLPEGYQVKDRMPAPLGVLPEGGERVGLQSMPQKLPEGYQIKEDEVDAPGSMTRFVQVITSSLPVLSQFVQTLAQANAMSKEKKEEKKKDQQPPPEFKAPEADDPEVPMKRFIQTIAAGLPVIGPFVQAFTPLQNAFKAITQSQEIGKQNLDRYNKAVEDYQKKLKKAGLAQGQGYSPSSSGGRIPPIGGGGGGGPPGGGNIVPVMQGNNEPGGPGTGALAGLTVAAGAVGAAVAAVYALTAAIKSTVAAATRWTEALNPSAILVLNQAHRDLAATLGIGFSPVVAATTGVIRAFADTLLPVMTSIQPLVQRVSGLVADTIGGLINYFGKAADAAMPLAEAFVEVFAAAQPVREAVIAIGTAFTNILKPGIAILSEGFKLLTIPIGILSDVVSATVPIWQAVGAVMGGVAEVIKSGIQALLGALGIDGLKDAASGLRGTFEQLASTTVIAIASMAKWFGSTNFLDGMIKAIKPAEKGNTEFIAAGRNAQITNSVSEFGRALARASLLATAGGAQGPKTSEQWLEKLAKDLEELKTGGTSQIDKIISKAVDDLVEKLVDKLKDKAKEQTFDMAKWAKERAWQTGKYAAIGSVVPGLGTAVGATYGALFGGD